MLFDLEIINFLLVLIVFLTVYLKIENSAENMLNKVEKTYRSVYEKTFRSIVKYSFLISFLLYTLNFFVDVTTISIIIALLVFGFLFVFKKQIASIAIGFHRVKNKVIAINDSVTINNEHKGMIQEITLQHIRMKKDKNKEFVMSHYEIQTIEKQCDDSMPITIPIVLSYREDPEKAEKVLSGLTGKLNETLKDFIPVLSEDNEDGPGFRYEGITELNSDYQGIEYTISGIVSADNYERVKREINREVAIACYQNNLKTTEHNVFFKTKAELKK